MTANSCSVTANGNGDGQIDAGEVACVPNHLFHAGFIKGGPGPITLSQSDRLITIRAIARSARRDELPDQHAQRDRGLELVLPLGAGA